MGNVFPETISCPVESALTDELLAEASGAGGSQVVVDAAQNPFAGDFEEVMRLWWLLGYVKVKFNANGTYRDGTPRVTVPWAVEKELFFDIAYKPNKPPLIDSRIGDCELYGEFEIRKYTENPSGPDSRVWDAWTHYMPFHGISGDQLNPNKDFPAFGLLELFCFFGPIAPPDSSTTQNGLFIISTRNRDYKDAIIEGPTPDTNAENVQLGFKTIKKTFFNREITFYTSLWAVNTNFDPEDRNIQVNDFTITIEEFELWKPLDGS